VTPAEHTPHQIAADTFLVPDQLGDGARCVVQLNSMVIRGQQPVVVDTGAPINRARFLANVFGLVEPADVRWVFVSHDDVDHAGNVEALMHACPNATLATSWLTMVRLTTAGCGLSPRRWLRVEDGDVIDVGDRALVVQRPPLYDAPTTYGLFDTETEVFWAADCFGSGLPEQTVEADGVPRGVWEDGFIRFQQWHSPWLEGFDVRWWQRQVDRFAARRLQAIASAHGPVVRSERIARAIELLRELPAYPTGAPLEQSTLEDILSGVGSSTF